VRCWDKIVAKHLMRDAGIPTPDFYSFSARRSTSSGRPRRCRPSRSCSTSRSSSSRPARAPRWASSSRARRRTSRARWSPRSPTTRRCCWSATSPVATSRSRCSTGRGAQALPVVEAIPQESDTYDFESRYEIGRTRFACPAQLDDATTRRAQELALAVWELLGCAGFARVDLMLDAGGELSVLEANTIPGLTETSLLPQAAEAAGIAFEDLIARVLELAAGRPLSVTAPRT
jgi:D-alanine-D-alanine ligase